MSPARPLGPARLVLTFVLLSALFLLALLAVFGLDKAIDLSGMLNLPAAFSNIGSLVVFGLVILTLLKFSLWKKRKTV